MRETLRLHCERECMTLAAAMQKGSSKGSSTSSELVRCKMRHCTRQPYHSAGSSGSNGGVRAISLHSCEPILEFALKPMNVMKCTWRKNLPLECQPQCVCRQSAACCVSANFGLGGIFNAIFSLGF